MTTAPLWDAVLGTARFSPCGLYRYELTRELGGTRPLVISGLNPSVATAVKDDRTIAKEVGFANRWGLGRLIKGNAYAYVAQDPNDMKRRRRSGFDVVGPENDEYLVAMMKRCVEASGIFLVAWGQNIELERQAAIWKLMESVGVQPMCLGINDNGTPKHPLYIPYARPLAAWRPA